MKKYKITFEIVLNDNTKTEWIEQAIEEQLEIGEEILDGNIEELENDY